MSFPLRALQIDLGRQKESLATLFHLVDFAARYGYNALHLYLEGRVRTPCLHMAPEASTYSLDEMRELVAYARNAGLDVIPQVNCLGHAEHILCYPELQHLSEQREGQGGRFGGHGHSTFCPSLEATTAFLETYLSELAEAFTGPWFHVGLDEVWDMGICSKCHARLEAGENLGGLYLGHLEKLRSIVVDKLGKRPMMWDDMLEEYPELLLKLPTDVVQCVWQYDSIVSHTRTHFGRRRWDDRLDTYERRDIDYLICPADYSPLNAASFARLVAARQPLGAMMTTWEYSQSFMLAAYPTLAFAGRLWESGEIWNDRLLFHQICAELFGLDESDFAEAVYTSRIRERAGNSFAEASHLRGPVTEQELAQEATANLLLATVQRYSPRVTDKTGSEVLADLIVNLRRDLLYSAMRQLVHHVYLRWSGQPAPGLEVLSDRADALLKEAHSIRDERERQWLQWRPGIESTAGFPIFANAVRDIEAFVKRVKQDQERCLLLNITYALPDYYGAQPVRWSLREQTGTTWRDLGTSTPKPLATYEVPYYTRQLALPLDTDPDALRLETWGHGGIGIMYLEIIGHGRRYVPAAVLETYGLIVEPTALLTYDTAWTNLGETETESLFHDVERARRVHRLDIQLTAK